MRRGVQNLLGVRSDTKPGQAWPAEDDKAVDDPLEDAALGLEVWVEGVDPVVDIVAIHGLNGHREKTWTKSNVNWLRDPNMLPAVISNARIMSWGYDANTHSTKELSAMYLYDHAQKLVSDLSLHRRVDKTDTRPIIFVAHSLGGIVLKSALIHADSARAKHLYYHKSIKTSTYGIIFMGTPHQGGEGVAWGKRLVNVASIFVKTNDKLLNILERDSEVLQQQLGQYTSISSDFETKFAFETKATPLAFGQAIIVVPKISAVVPGQVDAEPIAITDDHINMVKFPSPEHSDYRRVAGHLKLMAENAPAKAQKNWLTEGSVEAARVGNLKQSYNIAFDLMGAVKTSAFIGRITDLKLLKEQLNPGDISYRRKICIVHGLGGIGKTQLAIEYARLHKASYTSVFWLDGKTEESLIKGILIIASRLPKRQIEQDHSQEIKGLEESRKAAQEILQWFHLPGNTQWLLIYDNIDKTSYDDVIDQSAYENTFDQSIKSPTYDITQYFPPGDTGSIIITTRLQRLVSLGSQVHVRKLSILDSLLILENHAGRSLKSTSCPTASTDNSKTDEWDPNAVALVERLGFLPLALVFAGSYIAKTTIAKYREIYEKSWVELHRTMKKRHDYSERTIITTWQMSFDELKLKDEGAAKLLQLWGYIDNQEVWFQLLQWRGFEIDAPSWLQKISSTEISFLVTVDTILGYSLIERNENSEAYSMHAVVHDWIRASINTEKDEDLLQIAITTVGLAVPELDTRDSWTEQRRLLPHVIRLSQNLKEIGKAGEAENPMYHSAYLSGLNELGNLYSYQGRFVEAETLYKQSLVETEKSFGLEHVWVLSSFNNLGNIYYGQGRLEEAKAMYDRALVGKKNLLGIEHVSTLETFNNLGLVYQARGRFREAEAVFKQALAWKEKILGMEHMSTLNTVDHLGLFYAIQGRLVEAEAMYDRALAGKKKSLGLEHASTLSVVHNLGNLYADQGRLAEAERMYMEALTGREKLLGTDHSSTLRTAGELGSLNQHYGRFAEAEKMHARALEGFEKTLGVEHVDTLQAVHNLGTLHRAQNRLGEAETMYSRALSGREKKLGMEHLSTLDSANGLGDVYQAQGRLAKAEIIQTRTLEGLEKTLGVEHLETLKVVHNLGVLYYTQNRLGEAETMYSKALSGREKVLGIENASTLRSAHNLGDVYQAQGRLAEAEAMYEMARSSGHTDPTENPPTEPKRTRRKPQLTEITSPLKRINIIQSHLPLYRPPAPLSRPRSHSFFSIPKDSSAGKPTSR